jgi:hypothetical protein
MSYGLLIRNDAGAIQIDATYKNYCLFAHGEGVTTSGTPGNYYTATVTFSSSTTYPPLIALKPSSSAYCGLWRYTKSGNNYTGFVVISEANTTVTFDWMAFLPNETKSSVAYGLRVYDATTTLVFDNGYTVSPGYNSQSTITHPSDANAYFIMSPWGEWDTLEIGPWPPGSLLIRYFAMLKYISATEVSFGGKSAINYYIPAEQSDEGGYWPSWTILTVKKAF